MTISVLDRTDGPPTLPATLGELHDEAGKVDETSCCRAG